MSLVSSTSCMAHATPPVAQGHVAQGAHVDFGLCTCIAHASSLCPDECNTQFISLSFFYANWLSSSLSHFSMLTCKTRWSTAAPFFPPGQTIAIAQAKDESATENACPLKHLLYESAVRGRPRTGPDASGRIWDRTIRHMMPLFVTGFTLSLC